MPRVDLEITGKVTLIPRDKVRPPKDGIHKAGKDGFIKGVHSVMLGKTLIPKGSVGFFYPLNEKLGVKVYLGGFPNKPWASKLGIVQKAFKNMTMLSLADLSPCPGKVISVRVMYIYKGKRVNKLAYGLTVEKCHYPVKVWKDYAHGLPYDFKALGPDHPKHSQKGYFDFCERLSYYCRNAKMKLSCFDYRKDVGPKIGDAVYCMKKKDWFLVDPD